MGRIFDRCSAKPGPPNPSRSTGVGVQGPAAPEINPRRPNLKPFRDDARVNPTSYYHNHENLISRDPEIIDFGVVSGAHGALQTPKIDYL